MLRPAASEVRFSVQPQQEREIRDYDKKGKPRYSTRHWIEITNAGDQDAEEVVIEPVGEHTSMHLIADGTPTTIHARQTRRLNVAMSMGGTDPNVLRIRWTENGETKERDFHVG